MKWDPRNERLWKELIKKHGLEGIHVLMTAECYKNGFFEKYKSKFEPKNVYAIPTYLLVNKKGEIVNFQAPRPSEGEVLYKEIQKFLDEM